MAAKPAAPRKPRTRKPAAEKIDVYQVITDQMIELLEAGTVPWHKPWKATGGVPMSLSTKRAYRGINVLLLQTAAQAKGYSSPWWGTYKSIEERGTVVRRGEHGTKVVLWKPIWIEDEKTGEKKKIFILKLWTVFNAEQVEDIAALKLPVEEERPQVDEIAECEAALAAYYLTGPTLSFFGDEAYYVPRTDHVQMPKREQFDSAEEFYGAWFHETVHSTGHASRLKREGIADLPAGHRFGDELYSKEELVAEMGASFLAGRTGISAVTLANSAAYLASWLRVLKGDKKMIVHAAQAAQKAADLILGEVPAYAEEDATAAADVEVKEAIPA